MDKHGLVIALLFLFMIFLDRSNAFNLRKLVTTSDPNGSSNANQDSPLPSPQPSEKKQNLPPMTNPSDAGSKGLNDTNTKGSSENSSDKKPDNKKSQDDKEKEKNAIKSETISNESCNGNPICSDQKKIMSACIQDFDGSNTLTLGMQNERDMTMNVSITLMTSVNNSLPAFEMPGRGIKKVNITFSGDKNTKVILNAGNGDCELQISALKPTAPVDGPADTPTKPKEAEDSPSNSPKDNNAPIKPPKDDNPPIKPPKDDNPPIKPPKDVPDPTSLDTTTTQNNLLDQLSFYSKQVTPIYGAYFAFLVALVIGGSWAFCSMRKRRSEGGEVAYQELEMGNATVTTVEEGWDQDWDDDDWDEDKAIRSPGVGGGPKTISSNGLTARPTKKDAWDTDWDD